MASHTKLSAQEIDSVNQARRILIDLVYDIDAAEKCGIDCQRARQEMAVVLAGLDNIVKHFSPGA